MRTETVEIKIYNYSDILLPENEHIKNKITKNYKGYNNNRDYIEFLNTKKKFEESFGIKIKNNRYWSKESHSEKVMNLKGIRLMKYIYNNFFNTIFKGKYFSIWSKKEKTYKYYKEGYPVLKYRHSKVIFTTDCALTGVCYDLDILEPIYNFLKKPSEDTTFEDLIQECIDNFDRAIDKQEEYNSSDEGILESLEDKEFTEDGKIYQI